MTLYEQVVHGSVETVVRPEQENALLAQERIAWITSAGTRVLVKSLTDEIKQLELEARNLAVTYATHKEHLRIIQLLQQANALSKLIDQHIKLK